MRIVINEHYYFYMIWRQGGERQARALCSKELTAQRKKAVYTKGAHTPLTPRSRESHCETSEPLTHGTHGVMGSEVWYVQKNTGGYKIDNSFSVTGIR